MPIVTLPPGPDPDWLVKARAEGRVLNERGAALLAEVFPAAPGPPVGRTDPPRAGRKGRHPLVPVTVTHTLAVTVPVAVGPGPNGREHHMARARRVKAERAAVERALGAAPFPRGWARAAITLTRLGGRKRDRDNNVGSLKAVQDAVAAWLGRDDGDDALTWLHGWEPGPAHGVRVEVTTEGGV